MHKMLHHPCHVNTHWLLNVLPRKGFIYSFIHIRASEGNLMWLFVCFPSSIPSAKALFPPSLIVSGIEPLLLCPSSFFNLLSLSPTVTCFLQGRSRAAAGKSWQTGRQRVRQADRQTGWQTDISPEHTLGLFRVFTWMGGYRKTASKDEKGESVNATQRGIMLCGLYIIELFVHPWAHSGKENAGDGKQENTRVEPRWGGMLRWRWALWSDESI